MFETKIRNQRQSRFSISRKDLLIFWDQSKESFDLKKQIFVDKWREKAGIAKFKKLITNGDICCLLSSSNKISVNICAWIIVRWRKINRTCRNHVTNNYICIERYRAIRTGICPGGSFYHLFLFSFRQYEICVRLNSIWDKWIWPMTVSTQRKHDSVFNSTYSWLSHHLHSCT